MKRFIIKYTFTALAAVLGISTSFAANDLTSPIPAVMRDPTIYSPQVAEMIRYDHTQVELNTGNIRQCITLVDFQDKDFDFPISISYNASGFRPRESDNYVGRDWMLDCGGVIYRRVNGMPDDLKGYRWYSTDANIYTGFLGVLGKNYFNLDTMKSEVEQNPYKYAHRENCMMSNMSTIPPTDNNMKIECSPDIFYFSFGKHSGKFMINYDGSISVVGNNGGKYKIDLSGMKLLDSRDSQNTYIRIHTDDGYVYTFGGDGYASLEYNAISWEGAYAPETCSNTNFNEITAFHLTQIKAPNGRTLDIHYRDVDEKYHKNPTNVGRYETNPGFSGQEQLLTQYLLSGKRSLLRCGMVLDSSDIRENTPFGGKSPNVDEPYSLMKVALIDRITTDVCTIRFSYSARDKHVDFKGQLQGRFFMSCGAKLDLVDMTYNGKREKAQLSYDYLLNNRMFLKSVNTTIEGMHHMEYYIPRMAESEIPDPLSFNIDHWGFWRGNVKSGCLIPGMRQTDEDQLEYKITTDDRDATGINCETSLLKYITYPTGGHALYTYEPHRYSSVIKQTAASTFYPSPYILPAGQFGLAGGARIRDILYSDALGKAQKKIAYTYGSSNYAYGLTDGEVQYMPFYKHIWVSKDLRTTDNKFIIEGLSFNSEGFTSIPYPSVHIRYQQVTEHYLDPAMGDISQKHSCKVSYFQKWYQSMTNYMPNRFFRTSRIGEAPDHYSLIPADYMEYLKRLVAHPAVDQSIYEGKIAREEYIDEDGKTRKSVEYKYHILNPNNYSLCIYEPSMGGRHQFDLFTHIGRETFRMLVLSGKETITYHGIELLSKKQQEYFLYDNDGYLREQAFLKNNGDSLITHFYRANYSTGNSFQILPTCEQYYLGTCSGRKELKSHFTSYSPQEAVAPWKVYWNVVAMEHWLDDHGKLMGSTKYTRYDKYGNVIEKIENETKHTVYLWSHCGQNQRAKIENATYQEVHAALGKAPEDLSAQTFSSPVADGLHIKLPTARVYVWWCTLGNKLAVETAPNGQSTCYSYDLKGRLTQVFRTNENNRLEVLKINDYHLVNE